MIKSCWDFKTPFEALEGCKQASAGGENVRHETPPTTQAIIIVNYVGRFKENS